MVPSVPPLERTLLTPEQIQEKVEELATQINQDYADVEDLHIVGILKGAFIFMADLTRKMEIPHVVDFMALSSYGDSAVSSGEVRVIMDLRHPIRGKHVIIVEDIVDSGNTLEYLMRMLGGRKPASLRTCVFVNKERDHIDVPMDYLGFNIPDVWVVGYGLDLAEHYRTLPYIAEVKPG
jgi:hypoxanthine phosphoribosyltransferase